MVVRIGTWNLENVFKPPTEFGPKPCCHIDTNVILRCRKTASVASKSH
jgi:hypothetical protein